LPGGDPLASALHHLVLISRADEEEAILQFAGSHAEIREALARAAELNSSLGVPQLRILGRARTALLNYWPFLAQEPDISDADSQCAATLADLLQRETFYRSIPQIDQAADHLEKLYRHAFATSSNKCVETYTAALERLRSTEGWDRLDEDRQRLIAEPLACRTSSAIPDSTPIPQIRADIDACDKRLADAIAEVHRLIEGDRVVRVRVTGHFAAGIDTEEQLDAALGSLREECLHHIGKNKRVLIQ